MIEVYDIETFPNIFTYTGVNVDTCELVVFEISDRRDDSAAFRQHMMDLSADPGSAMVGYNNLGFDYPVIHFMLQSEEMTAQVAFYKCQAIIDSPWGDFSHLVWESDHLVRQIDLFKIHHFDNAARRTSLKVLEFNMGADNIRDLPYPPGTVLTSEQMDVLIEYNLHDVYETWRFYIASLEQIDFRKVLSRKYDRNFINHNDTKIGKDYFIMQLEQAGVQCFTTRPKKPIQTPRPYINLADAVLPQIQFKHDEFNRILQFFKSQTITETKGVFENVNCTVNGFTFVFGLGGIHGSISPSLVESDDEYVVRDFDVTSYYPKIAITNRFFPEHLGEAFCDIYDDLFEQRRSHPKGSAENAMLKLALNGVYGDSNNKYSPFYDPLYTMRVTINGQLMLCMLAEALIQSPDVQLIQANTDGITIRMPRSLGAWVNDVCWWWERFTGLNLEANDYSRMWIRDVNNYIAEYAATGGVKRKGCYAHSGDLGWHQNHSAQVVAKAAEHAMVTGGSARKFVTTHDKDSDFYLMAKVQRSDDLVIEREDGNQEFLQRITRCYVTKKGNNGGYLTKIMPPLPKDPEQKVRPRDMYKGWLMWPYNDTSEPGPPINREYYVQEAEKLIVL